MPTIELLAEGLTALTPMTGRSPGLHVSDVIRSLCLGLGHFEERDMQPTRMELGCIMEHAIIARLCESEPGVWIVPGELQLDGLSGTPDVYNTLEARHRECKLTWTSAKHEVVGGASAPCIACGGEGRGGCKKGWRYLVQLACYCYMSGATCGELDVTFANGAYDADGPARKLWRLEWTREELEANWRMVTRRAEAMRQQLQEEGTA